MTRWSRIASGFYLLRLTAILLFASFVFPTGIVGQVYVSGCVSNQFQEKVKDVRVVVASTQQVFRTDNYGGFRATLPELGDTLLFIQRGYQVLRVPIHSSDYIEVQITMFPGDVALRRNRLASIIQGRGNQQLRWTVANESYSALAENPFVTTMELPMLAFAANNNYATYSNIRRFLHMDEFVPPDAIRVEEVLNYFNLFYRKPPVNQVFSGGSVLTTCPWNSQRHLLFSQVSARPIDMSKAPVNNLVLLIDVSGSMDKPNKLALIKSGIQKMLANVRPADTISLITYGSTVAVWQERVPGTEIESIIRQLERIQPSGPTPGEEGIREAYRVARRCFIPHGNNRIILASDGDFNVGLQTERELEQLIDEQQKQGVSLTCLGVGMGNYKDSKLSVLAYKGNGNFSYIDNDMEAERVLVTELSQSMFTVASEVQVHVNFNPLLVRKHRLLGYDNARTALKDTTSRLLGGEIGAGHGLVAVFELELFPDAGQNRKAVADLRVDYIDPRHKRRDYFAVVCPNKVIPFELADSASRRTAALLLFALKLRLSPSVADVSWRQLSAFAREAFSSSRVPVHQEFLELVEAARKLYTSKRARRELKPD